MEDPEIRFSDWVRQIEGTLDVLFQKKKGSPVEANACSSVANKMELVGSDGPFSEGLVQRFKATQRIHRGLRGGTERSSVRVTGQARHAVIHQTGRPDTARHWYDQARHGGAAVPC